MKTHLKKIAAVALSAAMLTASFAVFAEENAVPVFEGSDTYTNLDTDTEAAEPIETIPADETAMNTAEPEETTEPKTTAELEDTVVPNANIWDIPTPLKLTSELSEQIELYSTTVASGKCGDNLTWTLDSEGTLTISGTGNMYSNSGNPSWHDYKDNIKKLMLNEGITSIGDDAFCYCQCLTGELIIPDSVTSIGDNAFYSCSGLTGELVIPGSVTSIGDRAFNGCSGLTGDLIIPEGVTTINCGAFYDCRGFTGELVIPDSVTSIGDSAFSRCGFTGELIIPDSVTEISSQAFEYCSGFTGELVIPEGVNSLGCSVFDCCSGFTGELVIPGSVTSIGTRAFYCCSGFTGELVIPDSVTIIGDDAFYNCRGFTGELVINDSATYIGNDAFAYCSGITDMYILKAEDSIGTGNFRSRVHWQYDLSQCTATISDYTCTGSAIIPTENSITVTSPNGRTLYYGSDYIIQSVSNNVNVGTATARIAPPEGGISIMSQDVPFEIVGIDISGAAVTFPDNITYQGEPCKPELTVVVNGKTLVKGTDYTISYSNNTGEGTGTAVISGIGSYIGSKTAEFEIEPYKPNPGRAPIPITENDIISASINGTFVYDGIAKEPKPELVYHFTNSTTGVTLDYDMVEGTDYKIVTYENNVNAGTAKIVVEGIGAFENTKTIYFNISPCDISAVTVADIPSYEYCKKDICPEPEIKIGDVVFTKDVDYTLSYENNRNRGTATVTITGKGNLSGTLTKNFEITPRDGSKFTIIIWL